MLILRDGNQFGWGSNEWILKHAIPHAPKEFKDATLQSLVTFLLHTDNYTARDVLDLITQGLLTGEYRPTADYRSLLVSATGETEVPDVEDDLYPENDNPQNSLKPITEEEIARFNRRLDEVLGDTTTGEPAEDPFEGWTIDEHA